MNLKEIKKKWKETNETWMGTAIYAAIGIIFALLLNQSLGVYLDTPLPVVTVSSGSMIPTMNIGDIVFIQSKDVYQTGDVIVFSGWKNEPIIHRVVAKITESNVEKLDGFSELDDEKLEGFSSPGRTLYVTRGDNNDRCDQCYGQRPIPQENVFGHSILVIPYLGYVKIIFVNIFGDNFVLGVLFIFSLSLAYSYIKEKEGK